MARFIPFWIFLLATLLLSGCTTVYEYEVLGRYTGSCGVSITPPAGWSDTMVIAPFVWIEGGGDFYEKSYFAPGSKSLEELAAFSFTCPLNIAMEDAKYVMNPELRPTAQVLSEGERTVANKNTYEYVYSDVGDGGVSHKGKWVIVDSNCYGVAVLSYYGTPELYSEFEAAVEDSISTLEFAERPEGCSPPEGLSQKAAKLHNAIDRQISAYLTGPTESLDQLKEEGKEITAGIAAETDQGKLAELYKERYRNRFYKKSAELLIDEIQLFSGLEQLNYEKFQSTEERSKKHNYFVLAMASFAVQDAISGCQTGPHSARAVFEEKLETVNESDIKKMDYRAFDQDIAATMGVLWGGNLSFEKFCASGSMYEGIATDEGRKAVWELVPDSHKKFVLETMPETCKLVMQDYMEQLKAWSGEYMNDTPSMIRLVGEVSCIKEHYADRV